LHNGSPIRPEALLTMMDQLRKRILRFVEEIKTKNNLDSSNVMERQSLEYLLKTKKWNPYCIRHSAITADSDYLPEYALKKKARWSMNSKQGSRYIKKRMGNELKNKILEHDGIITEEIERKKPTMQNCPRCDLVNIPKNRYCSKCSYPLKPEAYDEIKLSEEIRLKKLEEKHNLDMNTLREDIEKKIQNIMTTIDLAKLKSIQ
jgi:integrase/recombinase XerD